MSKQHLHEKLGITFQELGALLGARNMMATGLVTETHFTTPRGNEHGFNMSTKCNKLGCGTVTCIGGLMALLMGLPAGRYVQDYGEGTDGECSLALGPLFYPPQTHGWDWITPKIAALAVDNFLNHHGEPDWEGLYNQYGDGN